MPKSVRPCERPFLLVNMSAAHTAGRRVLAVGRIRPASCSNCGGAKDVKVGSGSELRIVKCPVCQLIAPSIAAVA